MSGPLPVFYVAPSGFVREKAYAGFPARAFAISLLFRVGCAGWKSTFTHHSRAECGVGRRNQ